MLSEVAEVMSEEQFASSSPIGNGSKRGQLRSITRLYQTVFRWFQANTFSPKFLASPWSHPVFGYLVAMLGQALAVTAIILIVHGLPSFRFPEAIVLLIVLLVAFGWGAVPSLVATLVGAVLLTFLFVPPIFSFAVAQVVDLFGVILYLVVGLTLSILASQTQQARYRLEVLSTRLETIFEAITDAVFILDAQGAPPRVNAAARALLGLAEDEQIDTTRAPSFDLLDELGRPLPYEAWPEMRLRRGETLQGEATADVLFRARDGRTRYLSVSGAPVYNAYGAMHGAVLVCHDVTERKRAEEHAQFLAEISTFLASSLDYTATLATIARLMVPRLADWFAVDLVDAEGHFELIEVEHTDQSKVQWAKELRKNYPIDPNALTGAPNVVRTGKAELYTDISDEMLVAMARNTEELALARQVGYTSVMIIPLVARSEILGVITFVSAESGRKYYSPDLALAEEVGRRAGVAIDNARLYREVQQARDQLDIILQSVADGIVVYDTNNRIIYANDVAAGMTGFTSVQDMMNTPSTAIVDKFALINEWKHPFPLSQLPHRRVLAGEREAQAIIGYHDTTTEQPERWSLTKSRPVIDEYGKVVFAITIIHDMTARILAEQRKDEFISMASHELKTPVTSLKGFTHVLQRRLTKLGDEQGLHFLARMDAQLDRLTKLISDLLDISRMQVGKLSLDVEAVDVDALVSETVENLQAATSTHRLIMEGRTEAQVLGDKDRLGQVLINLVTNAVKYSPNADRVIVHLSTDEDQQHAVISVQDFGIGIAETHHQNIFEQFYQVTDSEGKTYPGLGIGLHISQEIVKRHHGRMWVESRKGEGATFYVALPLINGKVTDELPDARS